MILLSYIPKLISVIIVAALVLIAGHFCLSQTTQAANEHSHSNTGISTNDSIQTCCQGNNSVNLTSVINQKNHSTFSESGAISITPTFLTSYLQLLDKSLFILDTPPPNYFFKQSSKVLLC